MPLPVLGGVERRRSPAGRALLPPVGLLVGLDRDRRRDTAPAQIGPVGAGRVGLVGQHAHRSGARPSRTGPPWHPDPPQHGGELGAVGGLPGRHRRGQRLAPLLDRQVHLRRQATAGPAQRMIGRLPGRRSALSLGMAARAGGVLMGPVDRGVHRHHPLDQSGFVGQGLQPGQDRCPPAGQLPGAEQAIDRLPGAVALGHVPPRASGAGTKPDAVDQLPQRPAPGPAGLLADRQQCLQERSQDRPLLVGQVMAGTGG